MTELRRLVLAIAAMASASFAVGAQIDLLLSIDYANASSASGGNWSLVAKTDEQGLFSLRAPIAGVNSRVTAVAPTGRVNGSATTNAGFATFVNMSQGGVRDLFLAQLVSATGEQGLFYGVGTLANGAPNYPGQPDGTTSLGPSLSTLTAVTGSPWGGDYWATGVTLATGSFPEGATPSFDESGLFEGSLFTSLGGSGEPGETTSAVDFTTLVVDDLVFGVATGDYNADGLVDAADYTFYRERFGQTVTPLTSADGDGDGLIAAGDLDVWRANYGRAANGSSAAAVSTPEPSGVALLAGLGLLACGRGLRVPQKSGAKPGRCLTLARRPSIFVLVGGKPFDTSSRQILTSG